MLDYGRMSLRRLLDSLRVEWIFARRLDKVSMVIEIIAVFVVVGNYRELGG